MANGSARPCIVAGNWKMHKTTDEAVTFVQELAPQVEGSDVKVYLAVPFTAIHPVKEAAAGMDITVGAQNMNDAKEGAYTGEIGALMLQDVGAQFVILGHSERRQHYNESSAFINRKVLRAVSDGLQPILCVGESLDDRDEGGTELTLKAQLMECLAETTPEQLKNLIVAYEPIWAIGIGHTPTPQQVQEVHAFLRGLLKETWGDDVANNSVIQYGGSVKPANAKEILQLPDVDGVLVGGASLAADTFAQIINYQTLETTI